MNRWIIALSLLLSSAIAAAGEQPAVGDPAPDFRLQDQNGDWHQLSDYNGQWLTLYFYPKDDTPGCTTEACNFRDNIYAFKAIGAQLVGVSLDDVESHKAFSDKYKLPFTLLADVKGETAEAYGVLRDWKLMQTASRESFIIGPDGTIVKHYADVDPDSHSDEVLTDLKGLIGSG
jgi:peroxiredoxin Q/BCP